MADLNVSWDDTALRLLEGKDRYTRNVIREEFSRDPGRKAIILDPAKSLSVTPVSNGQLGVVWQTIDNLTLVRAIVPAAHVDFEDPQWQQQEKRDELKAYIQRAVQAESKGTVQTIEPL